MLIQLSELCTVQLDMESTQVGRHDLRQALKSPHANHVLQKAKDFGCQGSFVAFFFSPPLNRHNFPSSAWNRWENLQMEGCWGVRGICSWGNPVGHRSITSQEAGLYHYRATRRLIPAGCCCCCSLVCWLHPGRVGDAARHPFGCRVPDWVCWVWKIQCFWSWLWPWDFWTEFDPQTSLLRCWNGCWSTVLGSRQSQLLGRRVLFWSFKTWLFCDRVSCRRF